MKRTLMALVAVALLAGAANAGTIATWHFDNGTNLGGTTGLWQIDELGTVGSETDYASVYGSASAKLSAWGGTQTDGILVGTNGTAGTSPADNFGSYTGTTLNDMRAVPVAAGTLSIVGSGNNDSYYVLAFDDAMSNVTLSYATRGTSTGFDTHTYEYSTDGGSTWNAAGSQAAQKTSTWVVKSVSFGNVFDSTSGSEMNLIKIQVSGATSTSGNNRFDNILVTGVVPEPATIALLALGGLFIRRRRA